MKHRSLFFVLLGALLSGCASHHTRIEGKEVVLALRKPEATQVMLACSLDGFKPRSAKNVFGRWEVTLPANETFRYFYRVDGRLFLPNCPMKENDDFGSENCIFDPRL